MKIARVKLASVSPYSQSRKHNAPHLDKESHHAHEERTWREHLHVNPEGFVFMPPMAFKFSLETAAKFLRMRIPEKGNSEYGKHFKAGVIVPAGLVLPDKASEVQGEWNDMHANGIRGSGKRVPRCYPVIPAWEGQVEYYVLDDTITEDVFVKHLREAGNFIGVGRFRPENGGFYGRYQILKIQWLDQAA